MFAPKYVLDGLVVPSGGKPKQGKKRKLDAQGSKAPSLLTFWALQKFALNLEKMAGKPLRNKM